MKEKQDFYKRIYAAMAVALLMVLLVPLIRLAFFSVPWYDDYNYGRFAKTAMEMGGYGLSSALKGAMECIRISWYAWQGTYSSIFFMVLMPAIWGEQYYAIGPIFLILLLTVSVGCLMYTLCREILKAQRSAAIGFSAVSAAMTVTLIHTAQAGFYWYNGGVHYIGLHSFALILTAAAVMLYRSRSFWKSLCWMTVVSVLAVIVAGGNFVTSLQAFLVLGTIFILSVRKRKNWYFYGLPVFLYGIGFFMNLTAPGNEKRAQSYVGWGMSPVKAILQSFVEGGKHAWTFTGVMTLVFLAAMVPFIMEMVSHTEFQFPCPGIVTIWSVCLYATGFTPSLYSMGHGGLGRTLNAVKLTWQLLLILNLVYWCGYWNRCRSKKEIPGILQFRLWFYLLVAAIGLLAFTMEPNKAGSFSPYGAYYYVHSGEADNFYREYRKRVEILLSDESIVELTPYQWHPWMICMGDLSEDPANEANRALADWYGKEQVICREP